MARAVATFLMFDGAAEEAMNLYVSLFRGPGVRRVERYGPGGQGAAGSVKRGDFPESNVLEMSTVRGRRGRPSEGFAEGPAVKCRIG